MYCLSLLFLLIMGLIMLMQIVNISDIATITVKVTDNDNKDDQELFLWYS